jgi:nucleoside-diphosphate-sugar epimerase
VGGPAEAFHAVNAEGTRRLVQAAAAAGVRRLVYLSTVKVLGEATATRPFTDHDAPRPIGPYALSKWQGERFVAECAGATEWVVLRPPLVYGAGVGGNVARLLRLCRSGLPLPLGAIDNRRSLISLANLVDAIGACLGAPEAAGATFLVRDGEDVSTPQLVRRMAAALGRPARLFAVPPALLVAAGKIAGQSPAVARLVGNLAVDDGAIRRRLGWRPVQSMNDGLAETAARFAAGKGVGGP